jgi:hypothetical protein
MQKENKWSNSMRTFDRQKSISKGKTEIMHTNMTKKDVSNKTKFEISENLHMQKNDIRNGKEREEFSQHSYDICRTI